MQCSPSRGKSSRLLFGVDIIIFAYMSLDGVSARLKLARHARGLSQAALRAEAGIPHVMMISGWERGLYLPRVDYLAAVARALGVTLDWLCALSTEGGPFKGKGDNARQRVLDSNSWGTKTPGNRWQQGRKRPAITGSRRGGVH
jgi:transcriptional regulator with XRE-family HTH domain